MLFRSIEVKGYLDEKSKEKIKQFKYDLEVYTGLRILEYVRYVKETYKVSKLTELYEDRVKEIKVDKNKLLKDIKQEISNKDCSEIKFLMKITK